MSKELVKEQLRNLAFNVYTHQKEGKQFLAFDNANGEEALRKALVDAVGGEWNFRNFRKNKNEVFEIIEDVLALPNATSLLNAFDGIVEVENVALGDKKVYEVENPELFRVATTCAGNSDIRRQDISSGRVTVETEEIAIKIYTEFDQFISGRINFAKMIEKARTSMEHKVSEMIYTAMSESYNKLNSTYGVTGTFDAGKLSKMIAHIEAKTGLKCAIYSTKSGLAKVTQGVSVVKNGLATESLKNDLLTLGYSKIFEGGTPMIEMPQVHKAGTEEFALDDNVLFILPTGVKIIKVIFEGEPIVIDQDDKGKRNDRQIEFYMYKRVGTAVLVSNYYGMYKMSN